MENDNKKRLILIASGILLIGAAVGIFYSCSRKKSDPIVMPKEETTDTQTVKKQLNVSQDAAEKITREIRYIQTGETQPSVTYYVTAPTVETAAEQVAKNIKEGPPTAEEKQVFEEMYEVYEKLADNGIMEAKHEAVLHMEEEVRK